MQAKIVVILRVSLYLYFSKLVWKWFINLIDFPQQYTPSLADQLIFPPTAII